MSSSRRSWPSCRRSYLVQLTRTGEKLAQRVDEVVHDFEKNVMVRVTAAQLAGFRAVMTAIGEVTGVELREE